VPGPFDKLDPDEREKLVKKRQPSWIDPMLATLTEKRFSSPDWIYERKLDGVRCLAFRKRDRVRLMSRNENDISASYPELVEALATQERDAFIVDGEIVAFDGNLTSFSRLQGRLGISDSERARRTGIGVFLYLFDVLWVDGCDTTKLSQRARKEVLRRALRFEDPVRFTQHRNEHGRELLDEACKKGWEGLIAKRADAPYASRRSRDWLKLKCVNGQELVIGGYTEGQGSRTGFGALLLGYYDGRELRYAGKVGTGFDDALLAKLGRKLATMETDKPPFGSEPRIKGAHWVRPTLVAEIGFTEWTGDGKLRHPRFIGLRTDKKAKDVRRERPAA